MPGAYGVFAKLGMGSGLPVTEGFEFIRDSMRCYEEIVNLSGISGSRSEQQNRQQVIRRHVNGELTMIPNEIELARIIPRAFGAAAAGSTYNLAETLSEYYVSSDRTDFVHVWNNCKTGRIMFNAREGGGLEVTQFIVGKTETKNVAGTFPVLTIDETTQSFILPQAAVTIGGNPYQVDGIQFTVDNALNVRFANSITATEINPTNRIVTLQTRVPWGDAAALYADGAAKVAIVVTFTNGAHSLQATFAAAKFPKSTPTVDDKGEQWLPIDAICKADGVTKEVVIVMS
jgi:hypothetical protein